MTETTYSAEQIEAIGGRRWTKNDGTVRIYINDDIWAPLAGLDIDYYKTGNVRSATLNGKDISNSRARQLLGMKVYWENGHIRITNGVDFPDVAIAIRKAIAATVA